MDTNQWYLANEARFSVYDAEGNFKSFDAQAMLQAFADALRAEKKLATYQVLTHESAGRLELMVNAHAADGWRLVKGGTYGLQCLRSNAFDPKLVTQVIEHVAWLEREVE